MESPNCVYIPDVCCECGQPCHEGHRCQSEVIARAVAKALGKPYSEPESGPPMSTEQVFDAIEDRLRAWYAWYDGQGR